MRNRSVFVENNYVNDNEYIHCIQMRKEPVEKLVESVEKFCLAASFPETGNFRPGYEHEKNGKYATVIPTAKCVTETDAP